MKEVVGEQVSGRENTSTKAPMRKGDWCVLRIERRPGWPEHTEEEVRNQEKELEKDSAPLYTLANADPCSHYNFTSSSRAFG